MCARARVCVGGWVVCVLLRVHVLLSWTSKEKIENWLFVTAQTDGMYVCMYVCMYVLFARSLVGSSFVLLHNSSRD